MTFFLGFALGLIFPSLVRFLRLSISKRKQIGGRW